MLKSTALALAVSYIIFAGASRTHCQQVQKDKLDKKTVAEVKTILESLKQHEWSYTELHKASDLVVIATFRSSRVGPRELYHGDPRFSVDLVDVVVSTFDVVEPLSGSMKSKTLDVVHLRIRDKPHFIGSLGDFPQFESKMIVPTYGTIEIGGKAVGFSKQAGTREIIPEYLLFLKRRDDSRFSLASGDKDGGSSVRILNLN